MSQFRYFSPFFLGLLIFSSSFFPLKKNHPTLSQFDLLVHHDKIFTGIPQYHFFFFKFCFYFIKSWVLALVTQWFFLSFQNQFFLVLSLYQFWSFVRTLLFCPKSVYTHSLNFKPIIFFVIFFKSAWCFVKVNYVDRFF